jgi:hypothetical protein
MGRRFRLVGLLLLVDGSAELRAYPGAVAEDVHERVVMAASCATLVALCHEVRSQSVHGCFDDPQIIQAEIAPAGIPAGWRRVVDIGGCRFAHSVHGSPPLPSPGPIFGPLQEASTFLFAGTFRDPRGGLSQGAGLAAQLLGLSWRGRGGSRLKTLCVACHLPRRSALAFKVHNRLSNLSGAHSLLRPLGLDTGPDADLAAGWRAQRDTPEQICGGADAPLPIAEAIGLLHHLVVSFSAMPACRCGLEDLHRVLCTWLRLAVPGSLSNYFSCFCTQPGGCPAVSLFLLNNQST